MQIAIYKKEKVMTVAEVAKAMGVSKDTIKNCIRRLFPQKMQHGKKTLLNEAEVTLLLEEIKNNKSVMSHSTDEVTSSVANATTELTPALMIKQAMELAEKGYQLELARIKPIMKVSRPEIFAHSIFSRYFAEANTKIK